MCAKPKTFREDRKYQRYFLSHIIHIYNPFIYYLYIHHFM